LINKNTVQDVIEEDEEEEEDGEDEVAKLHQLIGTLHSSRRTKVNK